LKRDHEIRSLTGLRGVAAIYVVVFHIFPGRNASGPLRYFISHGYLAVDFFFILSGFVMAMTYQPMFAHRFSLASYGKFMGRRFARIYPLYFVATLAAVAVQWSLTARAFTYSNIGLNLLMVQAWGLRNSIDGPAWSISAEFAAYLLFPVLIVPILLRGWGKAAVTASICLAGVVLLSCLPREITYIHSPHESLNISDIHFALPVFRCLFEFSLGLFTYRLTKTGWARRIAQNNLFATFLCSIIFLLLLLPDTDIVVVMLSSILIVTFSSDAVLPARILCGRLPMLLGTLSYSVYILHMVLIGLTRGLIDRALKRGHHYPELLISFGEIGLILIAAFVSHRTVEVPGRRLFRHIFERGREAPIVAGV
jgi:peptidoglycan/LPS O-acetylase OafA/YrhL